MNNERESGEVCVFSATKTRPCKYVNSGDFEEFQFAPDAIPVDGEFQVCLEDFCITKSNGPQQQQLLKRELTISQILREYGKKFTQVRKRYSDGSNGRCVIGVMMSYFGWDGTDDFDTAKVLFAALGELKRAGIDEDLLIDLNDSGHTFDEIADYLDRIDK